MGGLFIHFLLLFFFLVAKTKQNIDILQVWTNILSTAKQHHTYNQSRVAQISQKASAGLRIQFYTTNIYIYTYIHSTYKTTTTKLLKGTSVVLVLQTAS